MFASEPLDPYRTDDPALNGLYEIVGNGTDVLDVGGGSDDRLRAAADELLEETPDGLTVRGVRPWRQGIITWSPT